MKRAEDVYKTKLGSWWPYISPFWASGELDDIIDGLQKRAKEGHKIVPGGEDTFRAFLLTPPEAVKVFIFGLCPYHSAVNGVTVADGLAMSCSRTNVCQPSLEQFYNAVEREFGEGLCLSCFRNPDLAYLAQQGVFLGNIALTTEYQKVNRHGEIWKPFTQFFIDKVVGTQFTNIPVIFLGKEAQHYYGYLAPFQWYFSISHPASASYLGSTWDSEGSFQKINRILTDQGKEEIQWIKEMT